MRTLAVALVLQTLSNTVVPRRSQSRLWIHLCSLICLANPGLASADETVTYVLTPGSTITVYYLDGTIVGPEPISGSFDWTRCGHTEYAECFDTTRLYFQSASFSIHLHRPNELACGVLFDGIPLFDEAVSTLATGPRYRPSDRSNHGFLTANVMRVPSQIYRGHTLLSMPHI